MPTCEEAHSRSRESSIMLVLLGFEGRVMNVGIALDPCFFVRGCSGSKNLLPVSWPSIQLLCITWWTALMFAFLHLCQSFVEHAEQLLHFGQLCALLVDPLGLRQSSPCRSIGIKHMRQLRSRTLC
ncbi:hypothetical protein PRI8871_00686 [Pseudoprimorskyibacter insulae]|uniref:Uncharacterized protein n=1 Tax=Pseudoprimorskyibacter insulae TaxID=1695997 RepID=A0A2R8AQ04_9RHOB|nr:hypothetical protein PRI8871_00686 [Pseudoprimorskyibacter insulae]